MQNTKDAIKIVVVGSFVLGVTIRVPRMPVLGEGLIGDLFDMGPGGKGTNQAIAASRLGAHVNLVALLGDDIFADVANQIYRAEGIGIGHIHREMDINTGVGLVTLLESGGNCIIGHLGANLRMRAEHVDQAEEAIANSDVVLTQFEVPLGAVARAMELGRKHGAITIWDPAPAKSGVSLDLLANVDVITPNETEARILVGLEPDNPITLEELSNRIAGLGAKSSVITLGQQGAMVIAGGQRELVPAPQVDALDPTGAGDAFNAALAIGLGEGLSLSKAVEQANYAGAYSVRHLGVINGLPTKAQLDDFTTSMHCRSVGVRKQ
jgi:ribokinase